MAVQTVWVVADCSRSTTIANSGHTSGNSRAWTTTSNDTVVFVGDNAYENGSSSDYTTHFTSAYGSAIINRGIAVPGNHEYHTADAGGFRSFWSGTGLMPALPRGGFAHQRGNSRAPLTLNGWDLVFIDTAGSGAGAYFVDAQASVWAGSSGAAAYLSEAGGWLAGGGKARIVFGHHMRYNPAGAGGHGNMSGTDLFWQACWNSDGTPKISAWLGGHDHYLLATKLLKRDGTVAADEQHGVRFLCSGAGAGSFDTPGTQPIKDWGVGSVYGYIKLTIPDMVGGDPQPITAQFYTTGSNGQGTLQQPKTYTIDPTTTVTPPPPPPTVTVTVNGVPVTVASNGDFTTSVALATGPNLIRTVATDGAGLKTTVDRTVTRAGGTDTTPPLLTNVTPGGDTNVTNSTTTQLVDGATSDPESGITSLKVNGTTVTVSGGTYSTTIPLSVGSNLITVTATNGAGLTSTVTNTVVRQGPTGPALEITPNLTSLNYPNPVTSHSVDIRASSASGIQKVTGQYNTGTETVLTKKPGVTPDTWSYSHTLVVGSQTFTIRAYDNSAQHLKTTVVISITRQSSSPTDTTPPTLAVSAPTGDAVVSYATTSQTVSGTASDDVALASVKVNGTPVTVTGGAFSTSVALAVGSNAITVIAEDTSGNTTASPTFNITRLADQPPVLTISNPTGNGSVPDTTTTQTVTGQATDSEGISSVRVNGVIQTLDGSGRFSTIVPLAFGPNTITITAKDTPGLTTTRVFTITRASGTDTTPPVVSITTPSADDVVANATTTQLVDGTATDNAAIRSVTINNTPQSITGAVSIGTPTLRGSNSNATSSTTHAVTTTGVVASGSHIIVFLAGGATSSVPTSVADGGPGLQWDVLQTAARGTVLGAGIAVAYAPAGMASGTTITATYSAATTRHLATVYEVTGLAQGNPVDTVISAAGGATTTPTATLPATTQADSIILSLVTQGTTGTYTAGTGYTLLDQLAQGSAQTLATEYKIVSATGAQATGFTTPSSQYALVSVALTAAAGNNVSFSQTLPLGVGTNVFTVAATDTSGLVDTETRTVTRRPVAPSFTEEPPDSASSTARVSWTHPDFGGSVSSMMLGIRAIKHDNGDGTFLTPTEVIDAREVEIGRNLAFRNTFANLSSTMSRTVYPSQGYEFPGQDEIYAASKGEIVYVQLHGNNKLTSGATTDVYWDTTAPNTPAGAKGIVQGELDDLIDSIGESYKAWGEPFYFCFHHEPEDDYQAQGYDLRQDSGAAWARAFNRWHARWEAIGIPNLLGYIGTFMKTAFDPAELQVVTNRKWVGDFVDGLDFRLDFLGLDAYIKSNGTWQTWEDLTADAYNYAVQHGYLVFQGEVGFSPATGDGSPARGKGQWIRDALAAAQARGNFVAWCWQGNTPPEHDYWDYESHPELQADATAAMHDFANDPFLAATTAETHDAVTFEGSLDGAAFTSAVSPVNLVGLAAGVHEYRVVAIQNGARSDVITTEWSVDQPIGPPPAPRITLSPPPSTQALTASFAYEDDRAGVVFQTRLNGGGGGAWGPTTPATLITYTVDDGLAVGVNTFEVRAVDPDTGDTSNITMFAWTIDPVTPAPPKRRAPRWAFILYDRQGRVQSPNLTATERSFTFGVNADPVCEFTIPLVTATAANLNLGTRLKVWRNSSLVFHGEAWLLEEAFQLAEGSGSITGTLRCTFQSMERLAKRSPDVDDTIHLTGDTADKVFGAISKTNADSQTGIASGDRHGVGARNGKAWDAGTYTLDIINDTVRLGAGEYVFRPTKGTYRTDGAKQIEVMGEVDVYHPRCGRKAGVTFTFGEGGSIQSGTRTRDLHRVVNDGVGLGATVGQGNRPPGLSQRSEDVASRNLYGMLTRVEQVESRKPSVIAGFAGRLRRSAAGETISFQPSPDAALYWERFEVGDTVQVVLMLGARRVVRDYRVFNATVQIADDGIDSLGEITVGNMDEYA